MIYEKIKISDICNNLKESKAVITAYIPNNNERVSRYLRYIKNQPPNKNITIKKSRSVRKKRIK